MESMDGEICLRLAYEAIFQGDFESALDWFGRAIEKEPFNASYYYKASITCSRSGRAALAETYAKKAVELDPEDPVYQMNLNAVEAKRMTGETRGMLELPQPDAEGAIRLLRQAETLDPLSADAKLLLGLAYRMRGDLAAAIAELRDALNLEPQHEEAARLLRECRRERRRQVKSQLFHPKSKRNR